MYMFQRPEGLQWVQHEGWGLQNNTLHQEEVSEDLQVNHGLEFLHKPTTEVRSSTKAQLRCQTKHNGVQDRLHYLYHEEDRLL